MNEEEKLQYLIEAGGVHCAGEEYEIMPVFANIKEAVAFSKLPQEEQAAIMEKYCADHEPTDAASLYGTENLVKIHMPDDSMYPLIFPGDELTIAFREEPEDGDLAAVMIPGTEEPFTIREISYGEFDLWLIPQNREFAVDCCDPEQAVILGKLVEHSRDLNGEGENRD